MKGILLLSGGIDSPVAGQLMKDQLELIALYIDNDPHTDDAGKKRAIETAKKIGLQKMIVVKDGMNLSEFKEKCEKRFTCVFCKRMMLRIADKVAEKYGADFIVNGDNLAQVASQTLQNLNTVQSAAKLPVIRPLIGMDKNDIINIAKKISTYETSIKKTMCCEAVPNMPATKSTIEQLEAEEAKLDIDKMLENSLTTLEELEL